MGLPRLDTGRLTAAIDRTEAYILTNHYRGFDPYDCLKSPLFDLPFLRSSRRTRWVCQQALKRIPFQVRPMLGIDKGLNPVTLAFTLQGLTRRMRAGQPDKSNTISLLVSELSRLASPGFSGPCWGYDFDWQARYAAIPAFHPTVVATGFVTNALYDHYRLTSDQRAAELVAKAAQFVHHDLNRTESEDGICWSYSPTDRQQVLNASIKGARLCAQAYTVTQDESLLDLATSAVRFVVAAQREDGSWPYSVSDRRSWTDNFHTCYILDCLDDYEALTGDAQFAQAKARGLRFYLDHFVASDGVAAYYHDRRYPLDSTAAGQALLTLSRFGEIARAKRLAEWSLDRLALPDGAWKYRIYRFGENRLVYMRWSVASMYLGLSALERAEAAVTQ